MKIPVFLALLFVLILISCESEESLRPITTEESFSSNLFFSEYIEGTSFNKALEIVNLTGTTIDLAAQGYSIRKQANGEGNWMGELMLEGLLENNAVFVIANELADIPEITAFANQLKTGAPMDYNGNDPIGLFKNGELVDVIGVVDNAEDFAKDISLRRRPQITEPSTSFTLDEWEIFPVNTVDGLGSY